MPLKSCKEINASVISSGFIDSFDVVLTDCDGVLWLENDVIPGSPEAIKLLISLGKKVIYVTNNSTKTRAQYLEKLKKLDYPADLDNIIPTSYCVAVYLKKLNFKKKVYIVGSNGIKSEMEECGIQCLPIGPDSMTSTFNECISSVSLDPEVGAVAVGFDEHISYPKLLKAASYLKDENIIFIATNADERFPIDKSSNLIVPGTGTFVRAIETASGRKPVIVGKPTKFIFDVVKDKFPQVDPKRCIMIGDRLNTDILLGTSHGLQTLLVLSGIDTIEEVRQYETSPKPEDQNLVPDFYISCLGDLQKLLKQ